MSQNNNKIKKAQTFVPKIFRVKGEDAWEVQSASDPKEYHRVTLEGCDCKGFEYRKRCRHIEQVYAKIENDVNTPKKKATLVYEP